jgi:2-polyprenyl-3-methyl-5-hydroxy-6-metoxy-1,4-benzoquinol methylase
VSTRDHKASGELLVSICRRCGLVQHDCLPSAEQLRIYYSHHYRKDYKGVYEPQLKYVFRAGKAAKDRLEFLRSSGILSCRTGATLLDIGAGGGEVVFAACKYGFKAIGIEPNEGYSAFARSSYGIEVRTEGLDDISESGFAFVTMFHVLEHMPDPLAVFRRLYQIIDNDGFLLVEVPNIEQPDASPSNIFFKAHLLYFSRATLLSAASPGFVPVKVEDKGNLRVLFQRRPVEASLTLPSETDVEQTKSRLAKKGWLEYLTSGGGWRRPFQRIRNRFQEIRYAKGSPLDTLERALAQAE